MIRSIHSQNPRISLVGAGPGDPDLITRKALKALNSADVLLYDALVHPELLKEIPSHALTTYVGKRYGQHSLTQEEINQLMVASAEQYGHVVRLKGGDPFVFGRGHEEMNYAEAHGIPVEIIPGVSAISSVPASQGIPITKRGICQGCWILTATTKEGQLCEDLALAAQSNSTLVIFMGTRKVAQICALVSQYRSASTPMAIIHQGTWENEQIVLGELDTLPSRYRVSEYEGPGLIVIGEVVAEHREYFWEEISRVLYAA